MRSHLLVLLFLCPISTHATALCDVRPVCQHDQELCSDLNAFEETLEAFLQQSETEPQKITDVQITSLTAQYTSLYQRAMADIYSETGKQRIEGNGDFGVIFCIGVHLDRLSLKILPQSLEKISSILKDLETRTEELEKDMSSNPQGNNSAFGKTAALTVESSRVWDNIKRIGLNIDHVDRVPSALSKILDIRSQMNSQQQRYALLAQKLQKLDQKHVSDRYKSIETTISKFKNPFELGSPLPTPSSMPRGEGNGAVTMTASKPPWLDMYRVPAYRSPAPSRAAKPSKMLSQLGLHNSFARPDADEIQRILKLLDTGHARIVGDIIGRSKYAFLQRGGTCGICAQVMVNAAAKGVSDLKTLQKMEDEAYATAVQQGFYGGATNNPNLRETNGIRPNYIGSLLNMPAIKNFQATPQELNAAVETGHMVIVNVDAGELLDDPHFAGQGHIVTIIGGIVEEDPQTHKLIGPPLLCYINDPGTGEGGVPITAHRLLGAWIKDGPTFVEPLF